jgi:hypothetical protein
LLLAVHGGILTWAAIGPLATSPEHYRPGQFVRVAALALTIFGVAVGLRGRYTRAIACCGALLVASALMTPAVVLVVGLQLLNAFVVGDRVLTRAGNASIDPPRPVVAILTGVSLWIGLIDIAAPLKVHYGPVYAVGLILPLLLWRRTTVATLGRVGRLLVDPGPAMGVAERAWVVVLMTLVVLHLFVVAKPEVGYDALAMHLQAPLLIAAIHRWPFDITRYAWAVMPMGADWTFTAAYLLGGEGAARLLNFSFGILACRLLYELVRLHARQDVALASVALFASVPLAFLETSTLFVENLWLAFLLGTLLLALDYLRTSSSNAPIALAFLAAGAMQCKVIGVVWVAPLLAYFGYVVWRRRSFREIAAVEVALLGLAAVIAAWPYLNAWLRTGNPVFPFMNALFRSPWYYTEASFNNPIYNAPLRPWSVYEIVWASGPFIEGKDGAVGFHWLLLFPLIVLAFTRPRSREQWFCLALAVVVFVAVFSQQSYLRYLLPFFALVAMLGGWALAEIPDGRSTRRAIWLIGAILCAVNVRLMYTASWPNADLCTNCAVDARTRREYIARYLPDRVVADYLNRNLPNARFGFFMLNAPSPAGFVGYSRAGNWHDYPLYDALTMARNAGDILVYVKRYELTHIVYRDPPRDSENDAMRSFREQHTVPIWSAEGLVVAAIQPPSSR